MKICRAVLIVLKQSQRRMKAVRVNGAILGAQGPAPAPIMLIGRSVTDWAPRQ
jgi:hypothetical protein